MERCPSWPKEHDWKSCVGLIALPRVRIPPSPPERVWREKREVHVMGSQPRLTRPRRGIPDGPPYLLTTHTVNYFNLSVIKISRIVLYPTIRCTLSQLRYFFIKCMSNCQFRLTFSFFYINIAIVLICYVLLFVKHWNFNLYFNKKNRS